MGDPLSVVANIAGVLAVSIQSCQALVKFFSTVSDAHFEVKHHSIWLNSLLCALSELQHLSNDKDLATQLSFDNEFKTRLSDCRDDLLTVESRIQETLCDLNGGRTRQTLAKIKYGFTSNQYLARFSQRLQMYHTIFSTKLLILQL